MPTKAGQWIGLLAVGGLSALTAGIAQNVSKQTNGPLGFGATVVGGAVGAGLGLLVLGGKGVKFA